MVAAAAAVGGGGGSVDASVVLWNAIDKGGVAALLFIATSWLFWSWRSQAAQISKMQTDRYTENDERWKLRLVEEKARNDKQEAVLAQLGADLGRLTAVVERFMAVGARSS